MSVRKSTRSVTSTQIVVVLAATLTLFFLVSFASKALDAYRLRNWRDRLQAEIVQLERQQSDLQEQVRRRESQEWVEEALRDAGQVPVGGVIVMARPITPGPTEPSPAGTPARPLSTVDIEGLFNNPVWEAWRRLIWGFD